MIACTLQIAIRSVEAPMRRITSRPADNITSHSIHDDDDEDNNYNVDHYDDDDDWKKEIVLTYI